MKTRKKKCLTAIMLVFAMTLPLCSVTGTKMVAKADTIVGNPTIDGNGITTWDCIYFGNYWQNDTNGNGTADQNDTKEPIKWRVLSVNGNDAFLLADQNLDCQSYHETFAYVTWETCTLRTWLNDTFLSDAFTAAEQAAINQTTVVNEITSEYFGTRGGNDTIDQVYLLSIEEIANAAYGLSDEKPETRVSTNTAYTASCNEEMSSAGEADFYWLRSLGSDSWAAAYIASDGRCSSSGYGVGESDVAVRPVLHLNLSVSDVWSPAGTIDSNGVAGPSRTPAPTTTPAATEPTPAPTAPQADEPETSAIPTLTPTTDETATKIPVVPFVQLKSLKKSGKAKVKVVWKKADKISGYCLQFSKDKNFKKKEKTEWLAAKKRSVTLTGLKKKKTYYVRIRAYILSDGKKVYGKWSDVKKVKIKK